MNKNEKHYPLDVAMPQHCAYAVRDLPQATVEQRERALNATHWNDHLIDDDKSQNRGQSID